MPPSNMSQIRSRHTEFIRKLGEGMFRELDKAAAMALRDAKAHPGFQNRTGRTLRSVRIEKERQGFQLRSDSSTALYMDQGTKKHPIYARNKQALFFEWEHGNVFVDGKLFFLGPMVNHPGTKPTHFLQNAAEKAKLYLDTALPAVAQRAL